MSYRIDILSGAWKTLAQVVALAGMGFATCQAAAPPAEVAALDHLAIYVSDLDRSARFYSDLFGFRQVPAPVTFARWLEMRNGVMLHIVSGRANTVNNSKWDHFAVACADLDAMISRLAEKNIPWSDIEGNPKPQQRVDGVRQIFVRDPDGYWIEINDSLKSR